MVTVSIITPTFNRRRLIGETIDSVLNQKYADYEMIIVDDGSTDNTEEYIKEHYSDSRIKFFKQENKGQNFARNLGLQQAQGKFICFLDSDDMWPDYKLSMSLEVFEKNPDVDVVYGYEKIISEQGVEIGQDKIRRYSGKITAKLLVENFIGMSAAMVKADEVHKIGGMDETISVADDYSLWLRLSSNCNFYYLDEVLGYYRITSDQISKDITARLESNLYTVTKFLESNPNVITESEKNNALCQLYSKRVRILGQSRNYRQGLQELAKAFKCNPKSQLPWRALYRLAFPAIDG